MRGRTVVLWMARAVVKGVNEFFIEDVQMKAFVNGAKVETRKRGWRFGENLPATVTESKFEEASADDEDVGRQVEGDTEGGSGLEREPGEVTGEDMGTGSGPGVEDEKAESKEARGAEEAEVPSARGDL